MALAFALTNSALLALHAGLSAWFVFGSMREDLRSFLDHESQEFSTNVGNTGREPQAVKAATAAMETVTEEPSCAFRVRDERGALLAESGDPRLLGAVEGPLALDESWRSRLLDHRMVSCAVVEPVTGLTLEVLVDARKDIDRISDYLVWAACVFLASVVLAGFAGWLTASRGLALLHEVVATAGQVAIPTSGTRLELGSAPEEVREVGEALNGMLDRIDDGLSRMRTFTAGLAHELRSPLQNLIGETEVTLLLRREPEEYEHLLASNLAELHALSDAVDNMVTYCRTASPERPSPVLESFDLGAEARLRLSRDLRGASAQGVELGIETEGDTRLVADREGVLRVVRNLVANAVRWSPDGGRVSVTVRGTADQVEIDVVDEGPGVPAELGERIFDPFVSGRPRTGARLGYGLGLSICRSVVADHRGSLEYDHERVGGARFVARFPRSNGVAGV